MVLPIMTINEREFSHYHHASDLQVSRPLPSAKIEESLIPLQEKDPEFFEIASGIVRDEVHANRYMSWRIGRLARKYTGSTRSVSAMYRMIDKVEAKIPFASHELARYVVRREIFGN